MRRRAGEESGRERGSECAVSAGFGGGVDLEERGGDWVVIWSEE